jgi:hypothetical protein
MISHMTFHEVISRLGGENLLSTTEQNGCDRGIRETDLEVVGEAISSTL